MRPVMQLTNLEDVDTDLETTDHLTKEMLTGAVPDKRFRRHITDDVVAIINSEPDSELRRVFRDNALTYSSVLSTGKHSLAAYINAVKFVSLKLMGDKASTAYSKVFPDRFQNLINNTYDILLPFILMLYSKGIVENLLLGISIVVIFTTLIGMTAIVFSSLNERRREMAIWRAMGASPSIIIGLLMIEAFIIAVLSAIVSTILLFVLLYYNQECHPF